MSETTTPKTSQKISMESARAAVVSMFEAFELPLQIEDEKTLEKKDDPFISSLAKYVERGRLEITGEGDDIKIIQHLRRDLHGSKKLEWNWSRLGMGKARVRIGSDGVVPFGQAYTVAAPMVGFEAGEIQTLHPVDLSALEDIAGFFQKI